MSSTTELVPMFMKDITPEEREFMLLLNRLVVELFEQNESLAPSEELNGEWHYRISRIRENPELDVSYVLYTMEESYYGHVWLNVYLGLGIGTMVSTPEGDRKGEEGVALTPKQTFWICNWIYNQLEDNEIVTAKIRALALKRAEKLEGSAAEIRALANNGQLFAEGDRTNKIFDNSVEGHKGECFTNATIRAIHRDDMMRRRPQ